MAGSVTLQGLLTSTSSGTVYVGPYTLVPNAAGNYEALEITLGSGPNTINVPTWAKFCLIVPPTTNLEALTLKGITGDTGNPISPTAPTLVSYPASPAATFVITTAGATMSPTTIVFS